MLSIHNFRRLHSKERRYRRFDLQFPVCLNFYSAGGSPQTEVPQERKHWRIAIDDRRTYPAAYNRERDDGGADPQSWPFRPPSWRW